MVCLHKSPSQLKLRAPKLKILDHTHPPWGDRCYPRPPWFAPGYLGHLHELGLRIRSLSLRVQILGPCSYRCTCIPMFVTLTFLQHGEREKTKQRRQTRLRYPERAFAPAVSEKWHPRLRYPKKECIAPALSEKMTSFNFYMKDFNGAKIFLINRPTQIKTNHNL